MSAIVLWIIAVIQGQIILSIVLFVAAALVGPGYGVFRRR